MADVARLIDPGRAELREAFDGDLVDQSFAYPCSESFVGTGLQRKSYVPEVAKRYLAGRAVGGQSNDPAHANLSFLYSYGVYGKSFEQISAFIEREVALGRWVILTFHGVGGDWWSTDVAVLERLLKYLQRQGPRIWTAPIITIARYVDERRRTLDQASK